ncbi:MAG TPA: NAD(P)/FAD-dependent oxidoreductase [Methanococcaceae archaeon]|uniref:NAD(P)/FAD-dependent oxidoreductase n=1 Tax=Methanothermococcus okinawensis TaxID=155863 RepID=A0A832ZLK6_9EURY|nr:NAD(P)/FAD-dependent oxidoreductase [Methanococcaceae archaeon]HIP91797.1 NAD(P)/FAD-dependent oxidoreductase [Methanothermococcus okinawensis]
MRIGIVGGGLGGLLAGALLSKNNHVVIYEKLPYLGGRFTNIPYRGYQLSTGALHMIPHGADGYLAQLLSRAGCNVSIVNSNPDGLFRINRRNYTYRELFKIVNLRDRLKCLKMAANLKLGRVDKDISFGEFLEDVPLALKVGNSFTGWALSLDAYSVSMDEIVEIAKNYHKFGGPGVPLGGCKKVIDELSRVILENEGKIFTGCEVERIEIEEDRGYIYTGEGCSEFDVVISNISPRLTERISNIKIIGRKKPVPSRGIKISIGCRERLIKHNGVLFTPECERLCGLNCPSNVDRSLAKEGYNLIMAHALQVKEDVKKEIDIVLEEIDRLFREENIGDYQILHIQTFRDDIPVNHASNGTDVDPIVNKRLYLVGDGAKGKGGMEVEGIALNVSKVVDWIEKRRLFYR